MLEFMSLHGAGRGGKEKDPTHWTHTLGKLGKTAAPAALLTRGVVPPTASTVMPPLVEEAAAASRARRCPLLFFVFFFEEGGGFILPFLAVLLAPDSTGPCR